MHWENHSTCCLKLLKPVEQPKISELRPQVALRVREASPFLLWHRNADLKKSQRRLRSIAWRVIPFSQGTISLLQPQLFQKRPTKRSGYIATINLSFVKEQQHLKPPFQTKTSLKLSLQKTPPNFSKLSVKVALLTIMIQNAKKIKTTGVQKLTSKARAKKTVHLIWRNR